MTASSSSSIYDGLIFEAAGQAYAMPSLTVDVANQLELATATKASFGSSFAAALGWVADGRLRGDMSSGGTEWRFSCAGSTASNAVVLTGERVVIHVATLGHGVGYIGDVGDGPVFSKTKIRMTVRDTMRGIEKTVEFDNFSKTASHPSRFFVWEVDPSGEWSSKSRSACGVCGRYVLSIEETSEFYRNPDWTDEVEAAEGTSFRSSVSRMQVVSYDWRDVMGRITIDPVRNVEVLSNVDFRTASIDPNTAMTEAEVFDSSTTFPSYGGTGLSSEQKTVVIRDNAMAMLSSQGPILTADAPDAIVLGLGRETAASGSAGAVVATRPAAAVKQSLQPSRTFSMSGKPVATNLLDDLAAMTSTREQADFRFRDPVRVLSTASGIGWALSGGEASGMSVSTGSSRRFDVLLGDEGYEMTVEGDWVSSSSSISSQSSSSRSSLSSRSSVSSQSSQSSQSSRSSLSSSTSQSSVSLSSASSQSLSSSSQSINKAFQFKFNETGGSQWFNETGDYYLSPASSNGMTPPSLTSMSQVGKVDKSVYTKSMQAWPSQGGWYASGYVPWNPNAQFAISFWIQNRNDTANDSGRGILSFGDVDTGTQNCINLAYGSGTGHKQMVFNFGGASVTTGQVLTVGVGTWNFVVFNFNGVGVPVTVYINNTLQSLTGTTIPTSKFVPTSTTMNVGAWSSFIPAWDMLDGSIDVLTFHAAPLSPSDVNYLWNSGNGRET